MTNFIPILLLLVPVGALRLLSKDTPNAFSKWVTDCAVQMEKRKGRDDGPCDESKLTSSSTGLMKLKVMGTLDSMTKEFNVTMSPDLVACSSMVHPLSDFDTKSGHGNPTCRYEPSQKQLKEYTAAPLDIAIVQAHDKLSMKDVPNDPSKLNWHKIEEQSAYMWREYAKFHGYSYYLGFPGDSSTCDLIKVFGWIKVCAARQLIQKHKYLIMVDTDTFVTKPRLRMEPLFEKAGLVDDNSGKTIAIAEEWGSCKEGKRHPDAGDYNSGVILLKNTAEPALNQWFNYRGRGATEWAHDQLGFHESIMMSPKFQKEVTVFPSGCPINSPWGDFIAHIVTGSMSTVHYDHNYQKSLMHNARKCISNALAAEGDVYARCALCDLLPEHNSFTVSCPRKRKMDP